MHQDNTSRTHLKSLRGQPNDDNGRRRRMQAELASMQALSRRPFDHYLVAGDFNTGDYARADFNERNNL